MNGINLYDGKIMRIMGKVMDLVILNFLFIITSIPVITIGASCTSLQYVVIKMRRDEDVYIVKSYLKEFKSNFKVSTKIWSIMLTIMLILVGDIIICIGVKETIGQVLLVLALTFFIWVIAINIYIYPLIAYTPEKPICIIKKAILMATMCLPHTILMFFVVIIPVGIYIADETIFLGGVLIYLVIGFATSAYMNSLSMNHILQKYNILEERKEIGCEI